MPTIRDGRGVRTVHDMGVPPPASPSGPVERRIVASDAVGPPYVDPGGKTSAEIRRDTASLAESRQRGNSASASRARGAAAAGFVPGNTEPKGTPATTARPWALGKKRSPETKARMAAAMTASYERRRASKRAANGATSPEVKRLDQVEPPGIVPAHRNGNISAPDPAAEPEPAGPPPVAAPTVMLPCEDCLHAAVCSIKPVLATWAETLEVPVSPHEALGVEALSISCHHYLAAAP